MLRLSNLADYAVLACTHLARAEGRLSAAELAEQTSIPAPTMAKLAGVLTRERILISTRGPQGGVLLAREPGDISLADIIEAIDGPIGIVACTQDDGEACQLKDNCQARPHWPVINERVRAVLEDTTIAELARDSGPDRGETERELEEVAA